MGGARSLASCWSWAVGGLGQIMEEGHQQGWICGAPCSSFCNGCMVQGQAQGELYMQVCLYNFLKDAIVHLNIKYGLWFRSEIFVGFYETTTNKQSKQQQKVTHFRWDFFPFSFARWCGDLYSVIHCSKEGHFSNGVHLCPSLIQRLLKELYIKIFQEAWM